MKANRTNDHDDRESIDLESRAERALTECMSVLPKGGDVYIVVGENQNGEYRVDTRAGYCTCPDYEYRDVRCKHIERVAFATGERKVPDAVDGIDPQLGANVDRDGADEGTTPDAVAADGGQVLETARDGDDSRDADESDDVGPRGECWCTDRDLPCFDHFQRGDDDETDAHGTEAETAAVTEEGA